MSKQLQDWPIERLESGPITLPVGRFVYTDPDETVTVSLDSEAFDFHIDCDPFADALVVRQVLHQFVYPLGFEMILSDESEPDMLDNGWSRMYLRPVIPIDFEVEGDGTEVDPASDAGFVTSGVLLTLGSLVCASPVATRAIEKILEVVG